jgi:hypothetical protein
MTFWDLNFWGIRLACYDGNLHRKICARLLKPAVVLIGTPGASAPPLPPPTGSSLSGNAPNTVLPTPNDGHTSVAISWMRSSWSCGVKAYARTTLKKPLEVLEPLVELPLLVIILHRIHFLTPLVATAVRITTIGNA